MAVEPLPYVGQPVKRATINQGSIYRYNIYDGYQSFRCSCCVVTPHGTFAWGPGQRGSFTYTPDPTFHGQVTLEYTVTDCPDQASTFQHDYQIILTVVPKPTPAPTPAPTGPRSFICATSNRDTWQNHKDAVKAKNGQLLTIPDKATQIYIEKNFASNHYYIGLNDATTEGTFVWDDGDLATYRNWTANEPNNHGGNEDCVEISPPAGWTWNDLGCWRERWALVRFPWSEYNNIVCDTSNIYSVCHPGPDFSFVAESCPQTAPEFIERSAGHSDKKLSQGSIIGGSVVIAVVVMVSLGAVMYLGNKNQWSSFRRGAAETQEHDLNEENDKNISTGKDDTAPAGQEEELAIETC